MVTTTREHRVKYDVEADFVLPDLLEVVPEVARVAELDAVALRSDYYDTQSLDLFHHQITLHRRTGLIDSGWELKWPDGDERLEVSTSDRGQPPAALRDLLAGARRRNRLRRVISLLIRRDRQRLIGPDGEELALISEDAVEVVNHLGEEIMPGWREISIESTGASRALVAALDKRVRHAGARRSPEASALDRALRLPPRTPGQQRKQARKTLTADAAIGAYIDTQVRELVLGDMALRAGIDAVHRTRVATRRLRSTLRVFAELFDVAAVEAADAELRWYAGVLGAARDSTILRRQLDACGTVICDDEGGASFTSSLANRLDQQGDEAHETLQSQLRSRRYLELLDTVMTWRTSIPLTDRAAAPASELSRYVRRAERLVAKRARNLASAQPMLHSVRKAAKRARYAHELTAPVVGKKAATVAAARYAKIQDLLGQLCDTTLFTDFLCAQKSASGPIAFEAGMLYERQQTQLAKARRRMPQQLAKLIRS